ncbi:MAG: hypothetical protein ACRDXB_03080, partial [Actinomycetes bacterium]
GLRYAPSDPVLRVLVVSESLWRFAVGLIIGPHVLYLMWLGASEVTVGLLGAVAAGGGVLGAKMAPELARRLGDARILWWAPLLAVSPAAVAYALAPRGWAGLIVAGTALAAVFGVFWIRAALTSGYIGKAVPAQARASVFAFWFWSVAIAMGLGTWLGGVAVETGLGMRGTAFLAMAVGVPAAVSTQVLSRLRHMRDLDPNELAPSIMRAVARRVVTVVVLAGAVFFLINGAHPAVAGPVVASTVSAVDWPGSVGPAVVAVMGIAIAARRLWRRSPGALAEDGFSPEEDQLVGAALARLWRSRANGQWRAGPVPGRGAPPRGLRAGEALFTPPAAVLEAQLIRDGTDPTKAKELVGRMWAFGWRAPDGVGVIAVLAERVPVLARAGLWGDVLAHERRFHLVPHGRHDEAEHDADARRILNRLVTASALRAALDVQLDRHLKGPRHLDRLRVDRRYALGWVGTVAGDALEG